MRFLLPAVLVAATTAALPAQDFFAAINLPGLFATIGEPRACAPHRVWIPGHYERRCERVWIPGVTRQVWVEPEFQCITDAWGHTHRIEVRRGYFRTVCEPGRWEDRERYVWVEGRYAEGRRHRT